MPDDIPLTEDWLRAAGFRWHQVERQPYKHWLLWLGRAQASRHGFDRGHDDFGVEVTRGDDTGSWWYLWFRSDIAGRYSRFVFARDVASVEQLTRLVEALTDLPWDAGNSLYGSYHGPEEAARLRAEADRLDRRIAASQARGWGEDGDEAQDRRWPKGQA